MKKILAAIIAAAMAMTAFAGCQSEVTGSSTASASTASSDAGSSVSAETLAGTLSMSGSTSMESLVNALIEAFRVKYPEVDAPATGAGGSGQGVKDAQSGVSKIGNASRALKDEETADGTLEGKVIAYDGIAVVIHPDNPVNDLTIEQINKIYKGEITNWKEVGGEDAAINAYGREKGSGTRDGFEELTNDGTKDEYTYKEELNETGVVKTKVAADPNGIGYMSYGSVDDTVKAVSVDGVALTEETVMDKSYKIQRPFVQCYKAGTEDPVILAWFDFVMSDEGQQIVEEKGFVKVA